MSAAGAALENLSAGDKRKPAARQAIHLFALASGHSVPSCYLGQMRILFLCLGNICRSPAAEGVFRKLAEEAGLVVELDSAGTGDWHCGEPPYAPMQAAARGRGYDLSALRARQLTRADFARFDLILAMDAQNLADARRIAPKEGGARLEPFLNGAAGPSDVPDPWFTRDFDGCLDIIETGVRAWIARIGAGANAGVDASANAGAASDQLPQ